MFGAIGWQEALVSVALLGVSPLAVKLLWNSTIAPLTGARTMGYWAGLRPLLLSWMLFGPHFSSSWVHNVP